MITKSHLLTAALGALLFGTALTPAANAGCGVSPGFAASVSGRPGAAFYHPASQGVGDLLSDLEKLDQLNDPIIGLWKEDFIAPDGKSLIDHGYSVWHSDGTEILNSARPPVTSNFCLGVWKKVGARRYKLNHFAFNWDATNLNTLNGTANIREEITIDPSGNKFTGTFTIDFYDPNGNPQGGVSGTISAQRLTVNSPGNS